MMVGLAPDTTGAADFAAYVASLHAPATGTSGSSSPTDTTAADYAALVASGAQGGYDTSGSSSPPDTTAADYAALVASGAQGGYQTSAGSYSVDPTTGAVTFIPNPASSSMVSGFSNTALFVMAGGALLLVVGLSRGGHR